ncbi:endonuclease domain-containing protein [Nonlabens sp. Ci31]|nr:endonuclease domain-containing protein [Nonlabens sp. Ci31]
MHDGATPSVFENAQKLRDHMTETEQKIWEFLKMKPMGYKFRRQHPLAGYVLDFYCHRLRLSLEIDGGYHIQKEQKEKDVERTIYLENMGISEIRFTNEQVLNDYETIIEIINSKLFAGTPFLHPTRLFAKRNA